MLVLVVEVVALILLLSCSAFFSGSETAFFSLDSMRIARLKRKDSKAADRIQGILSTPTKLLSTVLIGNTIVNVSAASVGYAIAARLLVRHSEAVAIPVMVLLLLILGEVAPKRLAIRTPERIARLAAPVVLVLMRLFTPLRILLEYATRLFKRHFELRRRSLTEDEFLTALSLSQEEGVLDEQERSMIDGIIRLDTTTAADVMTPRVDLTGIDLDDDPSTYAAVARSSRVRFLPVYRGSLDNVENFLDVCKYLLKGGGALEGALFPAHFVPEAAPLNKLLVSFQKENRRVAMVSDEYGGTAGLLTRGDILEEIVAYVDDIDTSGRGEPSIEPAGRDTWLVDGMASLEDIDRTLGIHLDADGADRIAGWISAKAGHIPKVGEVIRSADCTITVKRRRKNRIMLVSLQKMSQRDGGRA